MDSGDITNSSDVEQDMVARIHAEDSSGNQSDKGSSGDQLEGSNNMDTDCEDAEDEVDIDDQFDQYLREEEEQGLFDGVEEYDEVQEDGADDDEKEADPDEPWTFLGHDAARGADGSGRRISGGRHTERSGGFMVEAEEAMIGGILCAGDLLMESLEELEDTLGIRIIHSGGGCWS